MVTCHLMGGLGNRLFQVSATIGTALRYGDDWCIPINWQDVSYFKGPFVLGNEKLERYHETQFHYDKINKTDVELYGYFQSYKYWMLHEKTIKNLLRPSTLSESRLREYKGLLKKNTCSVHVRRGDYLKLSDHHYNLEKEYYTDIMDKMEEHWHFVVFSDDIEWCKENFDYKNIVFIADNEPAIDLLLISKCKAHIIANSSFSWWGSYLSESDYVYAPPKDKWFGVKKAHFNVDDLYLDNWIT